MVYLDTNNDLQISFVSYFLHIIQMKLFALRAIKNTISFAIL